MTRRVVIGERSIESGLWVSRPGFDAQTATGDQLLLSISSGTEQIILMGTASPLPQVVALGLSQRPYVFITSSSVIMVEVGNSQTLVAQGGLVRPYPYGFSTAENCTATVTPGSMTIAGGSPSCHYVVVRKAV